MKENQGKIEDFLAELELKHLQGSQGSSQLNPGFSSRLDEFAKSIFEDATLTKNFTTELRYGMGSALGCKLVEMLWDDLSPSLGDSTPPEPAPEITICLAPAQLQMVRGNWKKTAVTFTRHSGVLLPGVIFEESEEPAVYFRALELGEFSSVLSPEDATEMVLELLKEHAWRFLTFDQVGDKLRRLWNEKPKLYQASKEERVPIRTYVFVLRHLLKAGVPIKDMDLIVESLFLNLGLDDLTVIAENVLDETEELICGKKEPEPKKRTSHELAIADEVTVELGHELAPLMNTGEPKNLVASINKSRRLTAREFGWVMPTVSIRVNYELAGQEYRVLVRGGQVFLGQIHPEEFFVTGSLKDLAKVKGRQFVDPVYGVPSKWVHKSLAEKCEKKGMIVIDPLTFISAVVTESALGQAYKLFTYDSFDELLDALAPSNSGVVRVYRDSSELRSMAKRVFYNLLRERVPIIDKNTILETIVQYEKQGLDSYKMTEKVRQEIAGTICKEFLVEDSKLEAICLSEELEQYLEDSLNTTHDRPFLTFGKSETEKLLELFEKAVRQARFEGNRALIVTTATLRPVLKFFLQRRLPRVSVFSTEEIPETAQVAPTRTLQYSPPKPA
ncbi:MAG: FHIPEP family type III secretion protein [Candidatus Eremiobacteraeota bacterium]|nr:FHIPEP family type III secretion protein [Candidatus Eremiobacteraeota bacterium]